MREQGNLDLNPALEVCDRLSSIGKAEVINHLLADPNLPVHQINFTDKQQIAEVLRAIANNITSESK